MACFDGNYPTKEVTKKTLEEAERLRGGDEIQNFAYENHSDLTDDVSENQMRMPV